MNTHQCHVTSQEGRPCGASVCTHRLVFILNVVTTFLLTSDSVMQQLKMVKISLTLFSCAAAARPDGPLPIMAIFFPVRWAGICKCNLFTALIPEVDLAGSSL